MPLPNLSYWAQPTTCPRAVLCLPLIDNMLKELPTAPIRWIYRSTLEIEFDIYLGDKDDLGADGIAFVIHDDPRKFNAFGTFGEGLGYGRFNPNFVSGNFIAPFGSSRV